MYLNEQLQLVRVGLLVECMHPEGSIEVRSHSIVHHYEFSLGWSDFEGFVHLELLVVHRLVEVVVVQNHFPSGCSARPCYRNIIIQKQFERGIPMEVALHLDTPINSRVNHVAGSIEYHTDLLKRIHEYLVLLILPHCLLGGIRGHRIGREYREGATHLQDRVLALYKLVDYERLNELSGGELRLPEINNLV